MTLHFHDTMSGKKTLFTPADPARVTLYVCGPTVYNHAHIGNFRPAVTFDVLFRVLRHHYGQAHVIYGRNFTDIDDKIIKAAQESDQPITAITDHFTKVYQDESAALGILPPTMEPAATDHIPEMLEVIEALLEKKTAYSAEGHILFDVTKYDQYGALSNLNMEEMIAGARVEVAPYKRNPADFVLWKPSKTDEPGWPVPAHWGLEGKGRPGWHLECSAMIRKNLGETIDIHAGGQDLRFPHHENEIAQSQCAHDAPLARYWLHNGFLQMDGSDKMSKSLGNVMLVRDLLTSWPGEVLRFGLLSAHYRQPLEWSDALLTQAKAQLDRFYRVLMDISAGDINDENAVDVDPAVWGALCDDMNTPGAMAALHGLRDRVMAASGDEKVQLALRLKKSAGLMGLLQEEPSRWFQGPCDSQDGLDASDIEALIVERADAKKNRNYQRADEIRDTLKEAGILIEDSASGTTWRRS